MTPHQSNIANRDDFAGIGQVSLLNMFSSLGCFNFALEIHAKLLLNTAISTLIDDNRGLFKMGYLSLVY